jgi:hypothetical protein
MAQCNVISNRWDGYYAQSPWLGRKGARGWALYPGEPLHRPHGWLVGEIVDAGADRDEGSPDRDRGLRHGMASFRRRSHGLPLWTTCAYHRNLEVASHSSESGVVKIGGPHLNRIEHWEVEASPSRPESNGWTARTPTGTTRDPARNHEGHPRRGERVQPRDFRIVSGEEARKTVQAIELIYAHCLPGV